MTAVAMSPRSSIRHSGYPLVTLVIPQSTPAAAAPAPGLDHGWSFSEKVGGANWLIDWMFCYARVSKCRKVYKYGSFAWVPNVRHHRFRARKPLNLTKVRVPKQKVGVANFKVGEAAATPTV